MTRDLDAFFRDVAGAPRAVLALDYDGTLAPFRRRPDDAVPHRGLRSLLRRIMDAGRTRVVVISGRPVEDVRALLGLRPEPEIWGAHGWEHGEPGRPVERLPVDSRVASTLAKARDALVARALLGRAEWKLASVAVHWRGVDDAAEIAAAARAALAPLAAAPEFELLDFAAGVELRCRRRHKGTTLAAVLAAEAPAVPVAYVGDDQTDEDAFAVLADRGLAVFVAAEPVITSAAVTISPGAGVLGFLARWQVTTSSATHGSPTTGGGR